MKKIIAAVLAGCVAFSFAACKKKEQSEQNTDLTNNTQESYNEKTSNYTEKEKTTLKETTTAKEQPKAANWDYSYAIETPKVADTSVEWNLLLVNRDYILPENYINSVDLVYVSGSDERLDSRAAKHYEDMFNAAAADGLYLTPCSGYRSVELQKRNFQNRIDMYIGQGMSQADATVEASKVILPPGTSEHNAGLAMDIICVLDSFENTNEYAWLCENAQDYGFILRYPKDKQDITKIVFEPWHWRYVGTEAAKAMKKSGQCLEEYLGKA